MVNASSNSVKFLSRVESTYGVVDSTAAADTVRFVSENIEAQTDFTESPEITSGRTSSAGIVVDSRAGGTMTCPYTCDGAQSGYTRAALYSASSFGGSFTSGSLTDVTFSVADNSMDSASSFGGITPVVGQIVTVVGSTSNDGLVFKVAQIVDPTRVILALDYVVAEAPGASVVVSFLSYMLNGTTQRSHTFERQHTDLTNEYAAYTGGILDTYGISSRAKEFVTVSMGLKFAREERSDASVFYGFTPNVITTGPLLSGSTGIYGVYEGGPCGETLTVSGSTEQAAQTFTASNLTDELTYGTDMPNLLKVRFTTTTTLPGGLSTGTDYWLIRLTALTAKVAATLAEAEAGTFIDITSIGTGVHTMTPQYLIIVTTSTEHNLQTGDIATIYGHTTNVAVNCVFSVYRITATTFAIRNYSTLANIAGSGAGAGASGTLVKLSTHVCFTAIDFTIGNSIEEQPQLSTQCGTALTAGRLTTSGSLSFYMTEQRLLKKLADQARTALTIVFKDSLGALRIWDFSDVEFRSQSGTGAAGSDQAIVPTIEWGSILSVIDGAQVRVSKSA